MGKSNTEDTAPKHPLLMGVYKGNDGIIDHIEKNNFIKGDPETPLPQSLHTPRNEASDAPPPHPLIKIPTPTIQTIPAPPPAPKPPKYRHKGRNKHYPKREPLAIRRTYPKHMKSEQVLALLDHLKATHRPTYYLAAFLWTTGLRIGEALGITARDIDFKSRNIRVRWLKTGRDYSFRYTKLRPPTIPHPETKEEIPEPFGLYNYFRHRASADPEGKIFPYSYTLYDHHIVAGQAALNYKLYRFGAHSIRHSAVTYLLQIGRNIEEVRQMAGHKDIATTAIYAAWTDRPVSFLDNVDFNPSP
jgi:integrase